MRFPALFAIAALAPTLALCAVQDLNGRWDITVNEKGAKRAHWLKVEAAGAPGMKVDFVGAPSGQVDHIQGATIENGELVFHFKDHYRGWKPTDPVLTATYRVKYANGKIEGTTEVEDRPGVLTHWTGVRAPNLRNEDAAKLHEGKTIELFDGKDLKGWNMLQPDKTAKWEVVDGVSRNQPDASDIVTQQKFWDFKLHAEYRLKEHSNSGIGLRGRYEIQIFGDYGEPASMHGNGALYSRIAPSVNASKPPMEWQALDITLVGGIVDVTLNGTHIIDHQPVEGLTAIAIDPHESEPGPIIVQGDHGVVEWRKMTLTPLVK